MKQYLAFYGSVYYPFGGMDDFIGDFDTKEEATNRITQHHKETSYDGNWEFCWAHVYDTKDRLEVYSK